MKIKSLFITALCLTLLSCGGGGGSSSSSSNTSTRVQATPTPVPTSGHYVHIQITPGTSYECGTAGSPYYNAPCITLTVCIAGTSTCDTVDNVLVDTGSYGLRVFKSELPNTQNLLTPMMQSGESIAECVQYADGTSNWGPIESGVVTLGNTTTVGEIPMQVLDASFPGMSSSCSGAVSSPSQFQLNGIIGVGPLRSDQNTSAAYFKCNNSSCSSTTPPEYIPNPITRFVTGRNNGLTLTFGSIPQTGAYDADGYGIFGVGSVASNTPPGNTSIFRIEAGSAFPINATSIFNSMPNDSFLDSGSNFFYFSNGFLPICPYNWGAFCPSDFTQEYALMSGDDGNGNASTAAINFTIGNADSLFGSGNTAFSTVGYQVGGLGVNIIDWGMPFYFGKTVYMVFASTESVTYGSTTLPPSSRGYWIY